ncbi:alpha/beta hydrolase [Streptomyces sp. CAU 1734]|uniref:alpha/beta fold hydrolase n=1 Tax=Streptomyces sp. CAU 1734 TaxID=3140360 RepID=UPI00326120D5
MGSPGRMVREGTRIVYWDSGGSGSDPPVVLLHGLAGFAGEWAALAALLSRSRRVIALDQRGHGASERRPADVSRAAYAADVIALLDQLGCAEAALVGQALGGHTAMLTAAAHPGRITAVVMVDAGVRGTNDDGPEHIRRCLAAWPIPFPSPEVAAKFLGGGVRGEVWAAGLEEREDGWWPRFDSGVMVETLRETALRSYWPEWRGVRAPVLLVVGEWGLVSGSEGMEMMRRRPETVAMSVPGSGYDVHLERPDVLCAVIEDFLRDAAVAEAERRAHGGAADARRGGAADGKPPGPGPRR